MATLDQRQKRATYWRSGRMSPALQRARQPFRAKNLMMGAGIMTFTFGVYMYSIAAVKQDDFSDIPAPSMERISELNREKEQAAHKEELSTSQNPPARLPPIGLLGSSTSWLRGSNANSLLVHGAPPIDHIGKINDRQLQDNNSKSV
ncbi:uncharacterized protein VP01_2887g3 [Puccinia sorghi]|uniref:Cytochrome c oxidase assembly factor 3 n=1 Tax=Puccinia sorghi TaxID=27349 RepID=A0A0L6V1P7_9BASI|nr:uncharacterized protein VP01_2887g3 [Puccinia sorghi]